MDSLGGGNEQLIPDSGSVRNRLASQIDREADCLLAHGRHLVAERLSWRAADLRTGAPH